VFVLFLFAHQTRFPIRHFSHAPLDPESFFQYPVSIASASSPTPLDARSRSNLQIFASAKTDWTDPGESRSITFTANRTIAGSRKSKNAEGARGLGSEPGLKFSF
jgi:hypothetical protein